MTRETIRVGCVSTLPGDVQAYQRTPEFDEHTVPRGLLRAHTTKPGVWGRIVVVQGTLLYRVPARGVELLLDASQAGIIEPEVPHEVELRGSVRFYVEFLK
ncbi:MAG: DUF1971 domain-containing protein [Myxococcales bacterium]|nr:MAG: DUF1971 domain-containing protein [Myxococcales bacterium]